MSEWGGGGSIKGPYQLIDCQKVAQSLEFSCIAH